MTAILKDSDIGSILREDCILCICKLLEGKNLQKRRHVKELIPSLIEVLNKDDSSSIRNNGLWILKFIIEANESIILKIAKSEGIETIIKLLDIEDENQLNSVINLIGKIAEFKNSYAEHIVNCGVLSYFKKLLNSELNDLILEELIWTLAKICKAYNKFADEIIKQGLDKNIINCFSNSSEEIK